MKLCFIFIFITLAFQVFSQTSGSAYCTYHLYSASTPLTNVACSDGQYGIMSWGYKDLSPMFPYVSAWEQLGWNNPKCGTCVQVTYRTKSIFVTTVDQCGKSPAGGNHFDLSK